MSAWTGPRHVVMTALAVALMGGAVSCGDDDTSDLPPPASPPSTADQTPGLDLSPAEQQAVDEAQAKFDEFMNAYIDVSTADIPTADAAEDLFAEVDQHTGGGDLPADLRGEIVGRWGNGIMLEGSLIWELVRVIGTDLDREVQGEEVPEIVLQYCVDATDWVGIDGGTGETVEEAPGRNVWTATAYWHDDWGGLGQGPEGWRIGELDTQRDQPC